MLLSELVTDPTLQLQVLNGGPEALRQGVRWVYTTDLPDPARYLSGGELVLSGLIWRSCPQDSETFVAAVASSGASALAAGETVFHGIPEDLITACRKHNLVLISVPEATSFATVTERVIGSVTAARNDLLANSLGRQRTLLSAVAQGLGLDEVAGQVSSEAGVRCRVVTATGREVVAGPERMTAPDLDRVTRSFLTAHRLPACTGTSRRAGSSGGDGGSGEAFSVLPVGPALEQRLTGWFVVAEGDWSGWDTETSDIVADLVSIAALDRARRAERIRVAHDIADDAVAMIAGHGAERSETAARIRQAGLDPEQPVILAAATFPQRPEAAETARAVLDDAAAQLGPPVVGMDSDGAAVALIAARPGALQTFVAALHRLEPGLQRSRLTVGISEPCSLAALSGALDEAHQARRIAEVRPGPLSVVNGAEVTSHVSLLATVPDEVRRSFAERVLGPVRNYDAEHSAELMQTLQAFLDCSGSWSKVAQQLHLHVNTVRYRIARIEELTGRDLAQFTDRVDVYLAMQSR